MAGLSAFLPTLFDLTRPDEESNEPDEESTDVAIKEEGKKKDKNHTNDSSGQGASTEEQDEDEEEEEDQEEINDAQESQDKGQDDVDDDKVEGINEKTKEPVTTRGTQSSTWDQLATELVLEVVTQQVTKVRGFQQPAPGTPGCVHLDGMAWKDIVQMIVETHNKKCTHTGVTLNHHMVGMTSTIVGDMNAEKTTKGNVQSPVKKPDGRILANRPPIRGRVKMRGGKVNTTNRVRTLLPNNRSNNVEQLQKNANSRTNFEAEFQARVEKLLVADDGGTKVASKETEENHVGKRNLEQMEAGTQGANQTTGPILDDDDIDIAQCKECKRWFQSSEQLKRHMVAHATDRGPHTCEFCKFNFPTEFDLQNHMLAAHKDKMPPSENDENVRFGKRGGRRKKIKTEDEDNSDQEVFECDMCKTVVRTATGLKMHITKVHKNRNEKTEEPEMNQVALSQEIMMNVGPVGNWNQKCQVCKEVFKSKMQLEKHMSIHSINNGDHNCEECGKKCRTQWNLQRHMMIHNKIKRHKCPHCDSSFGTKLLFEHHLDKVHKAGVTYTCEVDGCGAKYKNKTTLKYHMLEHSGQKTFVCNFCNDSFPRPDALRIHKTRHKPKRYNCTLCNKAYPYRSLLIRHWQNTHWKEETVKCQYCDKVFQNYYQKNVHEFAIHTGERLYTCPTCGKGFHQRSALAIHEKIHSGDKSWVCEVCDKRFITKSQMIRHKRIHDPTVRKMQFMCSFCNMEFQYKHQWQDHENRHRGIKPHQCDECDARFVARCDLSRHKRVHLGNAAAQIFVCVYCNMQFKQKAAMEKHEMTMHLQFDEDEEDTDGVVVFKLKK